MSDFWQGVHVAATMILSIIVFGLVAKTGNHPFSEERRPLREMSQATGIRKEYQIPSTDHCLWLFFKSVDIAKYSPTDIDFAVLERDTVAFTTYHWMRKVELDVCFYCNLHVLCQSLAIYPHRPLSLAGLEVKTRE